MNKWTIDQSFPWAITDDVTGEQLEYQDLIKNPATQKMWFQSLANNLGRLSQGIRDIKGTDNILFIPKSEIPTQRLKAVTYGRIVVGYKPDKLEKHRYCLTVEWDRIVCREDPITPTADVSTIILLWYSVLLPPGTNHA